MMVFRSDVVNILVASPGDLEAERNRIPSILNRWNDANQGIHLSPVMWETNSVPELGDHPQHLLDRRLIPKSELLIAMFWSKIGTPTPTAPSGTIEEIREFIRIKGPGRVQLYFCDRPINESPGRLDPVAIALVQEFKSEMQAEGLYSSFDSIADLESKLTHDLSIKVAELLSGKLPIPESTEVDVGLLPEWCKPDHPDERLRTPMNVGVGLVEIAQGLILRMNEVDNIGGANNDNFVDLGTHLLHSAATSLEDLLTRQAYDVPVVSRQALRGLITRFRSIADNSVAGTTTYAPRGWREFWESYRELCEELHSIAQRAAA